MGGAGNDHRIGIGAAGIDADQPGAFVVIHGEHPSRGKARSRPRDRLSATGNSLPVREMRVNARAAAISATEIVAGCIWANGARRGNDGARFHRRQAMYRLHNSAGSGGFAVEAVLAELGVKYQLVHVDLAAAGHRAPAFLKLNPMAQVPVLEVPGGKVMTESAAMVLYLADRHSKPAPGAGRQFAAARRLPALAVLLLANLRHRPAWRAAASTGARSSPLWSWPPAMRITGIWGKAAAIPEREAWCRRSRRDGGDRAAMALDHGVGGQRRRYRNEADAAGGIAGGQKVEHPPHGLGHADGQVAAGGERLGGGDDGVGGAGNDHRIGIGAAGIDADQPGAFVVIHGEHPSRGKARSRPRDRLSATGNSLPVREMRVNARAAAISATEM